MKIEHFQLSVPALLLVLSLVALVGVTVLITREKNKKTRAYLSIFLGVLLAVISAWYILPGAALHEGKSSAHAYLLQHPKELDKLNQGAAEIRNARRLYR